MKIEPSQPPPPTLLTAAEVAGLLRLDAKTLANWRCTGRGALPYLRVGRRIRYRRADVEALIAEGVVGTGDAQSY